MNAKPHRQNSDFQLRHFLVGDCKTPDGAYILMYGQMIDMQQKVGVVEAQRKRRLAKQKAAELIINSSEAGEVAKLNAEADLIEIESEAAMWEMNVNAAKQELETIRNLMLELRPKCKYAHLDILAMSEAAQEEEWLEELKTRAENFILTQGVIPADHFNTMRCHPRFKEVLVPHIVKLNNAHIAISHSRSMEEYEQNIMTILDGVSSKPLLLENKE